MLTRRQFVTTGALAASAPMFVPRLGTLMWDMDGAEPDEDDILFKALALRAIDAAKGAGAAYADVRLTRTLRYSWSGGLTESQSLAAGVRALVNGAWGFAAGPYWTAEDMARLAREAVSQARINATLAETLVELVPVPVVSGRWTTPIVTDPFSLSYDELHDTFGALRAEPDQYRYGGGGNVTVDCEKVDKTCATTEGSLFTQTTYTTGGSYSVSASREAGRAAMGVSRTLPSAGAGWEYFTEAKFFDVVPEMIDEALRQDGVPRVPVEVGRYDVIFDADTVAGVLGETFGAATQLDRAMGYEANASGTSYLNAPATMAGVAKVASPLVTVRADRTMTRGAATVSWDDDGVRPTPFTIVRDGVLQEYQTTREQMKWLARGTPSGLHGCASAPSALDVPMQHTPNLTLAPGRDDITFEQLVAGTRRGVAVTRGRVETDFQARSGSCGGFFREIKDGKLGAVLTDAGLLFETTELWNNITALGGVSSVQRETGRSTKGEPEQRVIYSIAAVPMAVKNMAVIDVKRRA